MEAKLTLKDDELFDMEGFENAKQYIYFHVAEDHSLYANLPISEIHKDDPNTIKAEIINGRLKSDELIGVCLARQQGEFDFVQIGDSYYELPNFDNYKETTEEEMLKWIYTLDEEDIAAYKAAAKGE